MQFFPPFLNYRFQKENCTDKMTLETPFSKLPQKRSALVSEVLRNVLYMPLPSQ